MRTRPPDDGSPRLSALLDEVLDVEQVAFEPALAVGPWPRGAERRYPKCWYQPIEDRDLAALAERFALSEDLTAILPPGEPVLFKMALEIARDFTELTPEERAVLVRKAKGLKPLLRE